MVSCGAWSLAERGHPDYDLIPEGTNSIGLETHIATESIA